jgi:hypothetical protein
VPDGFNPNVFLLIDEIDNPVGADTKREFAFEIAEHFFPGKGISVDLSQGGLNLGLTAFRKSKKVFLESAG